MYRNRTVICDFCNKPSPETTVVRVGNEHTGDACYECSKSLISQIKDRQTDIARKHYAESGPSSSV